MEHTDESRKRINRYKKIIVYFLISLIVITIVLWVYILYRLNAIDNRIDKLGMNIINDVWRIY